MRITIDEITGDGSVVRFSFESGHADGVWRGESRPQVGPADVDWAIAGRFWWGDDVRVRPLDPRAQAVRDDTLSVAGLAMGLTPEGVLSLQIAGVVVDLQTGGDAPAGLLGAVVEVDSPLIELFPLAR
ncbi:MAG: hypothetical protein AAGC46_11435 [Solirubrobacteraceae bacterium]